jgi:hypothetical protein
MESVALKVQGIGFEVTIVGVPLLVRVDESYRSAAGNAGVRVGVGNR